MTETITMDELKELVEREKIRPEQLYTKEEIINDPKIKEKIEQLIKAEEEKQMKERKEEEDQFIPGTPNRPLTEEQKRQQEKDNELVADGKSDSGDDDLIPD